MTEHQNPEGFNGMGLAPHFLDILATIGFTNPTPIQHKAMPIALEGKDVIGIAQTGTGKTLAFGLPMMQRLAAEKGRGLVVVPTRELAYQVEETLKKFSAKTGIHTAVFVGGASMGLQRQMLRRNPRVLIATPGRLIDHLEQGTVTLKEVNILVMDEADRMLDMGFAPQINRILQFVPTERQTMLFSATMPQDIVKLATTHMKLPLRVEVAPPGTTAERVEQELYVVQKDQKLSVLEKLLLDHKGTVLVFSRTKHGAKKITQTIIGMGHKAAEIHANRTLAQRREALDGFKKGRYRVLVATDIAARGIDVTGIELVVNFDLPNTAEDYVHRIGRTGRAGQEGKAVSLATPDQSKDIRAIEKLIRAPLKRSSVAGVTLAEFSKQQSQGQFGGHKRHYGRNRSSAQRPRRQNHGQRREGSHGQRRGGHR